MTAPRGVIKSNSPHGLVELILNLQKYPNPHAKTQFTHMSAPPSIIFLHNAQSVISLSAELRRRGRVKLGGERGIGFLQISTEASRAQFPTSSVKIEHTSKGEAATSEKPRSTYLQVHS